jgi:hypothetical protein
LLDGAHAECDAVVASFVHFIPDAFGMARIFTDDVAAQLFNIAQTWLGGKTACRFAQANDAVICVELDKDPVLPGIAHHKCPEIGNTHRASVFMVRVHGVGEICGSAPKIMP